MSCMAYMACETRKLCVHTAWHVFKRVQRTHLSCSSRLMLNEDAHASPHIPMCWLL